MNIRRTRPSGRFTHALTLTAALCASAVPALAADNREQPLSVRNSFRIGTSGVTCTAQNAPLDARLGGIFDRGYRLSCRDAAGSIGTLIAVRREVVLGTEPTGLAGITLDCGGPGAVEIASVGRVLAMNCRDQKAGVEYKRYAARRGGITHFVEGLAGYDPALRLALASAVNDAAIPGEIRVATTEVSDPAAFARVQAGQLDRLGARDEGYLRNNGVRFAESAEFFETLAARDRLSGTAGLAEALANQGLQQSNLGNFTAADRLFVQAAAYSSRSDGVTQRLIRNYRAINRLNQRRPVAALKELSANIAQVDAIFDPASLSSGLINVPLSEQLNRPMPNAPKFSMRRRFRFRPPPRGCKASSTMPLPDSGLRASGSMRCAADASPRPVGCGRKSRSSWPCWPKRKGAGPMQVPRSTGQSGSLPQRSRNRPRCYRRRPARPGGSAGRATKPARSRSIPRSSKTASRCRIPVQPCANCSGPISVC
ncbi:MAG: hypothetical protein NTX28_05345 [Novosphingobium sp.]|nr:hypothetical protein [Novosphingobium sp.]